MNNEIFLMQINGFIVRIPQFLCQILELNTNRNMQLQQIEEQLSNPLTLQHMQERYADATNLAFLQDQLRIFQQNCFNNWENIDQQTRNSQIIFVSENLSNILGIAIMPIELSIQEQSHFNYVKIMRKC
ncbi:hypothetical protein [Spiroplasma endosymbiont of Eupeodes luniger]|uniref:hypothetical protein n=1 Tax=Spiroplasma endosymbiont of Eupeodes luniger TaxID=3066300 RepID=UPI0030D3F8AD